MVGELGDILHAPNMIAVGNVGAVYETELRGDWKKALGITWQTDSDITGKVALKLAQFRDPKDRVEVLTDLAKAIDRERAANPDFPLCPFLALGLLPDRSHDWVIEIMPFLPGTGLANVINKTGPGDNCLTELVRVLGTVTMLEREGFYTRNLDLENIVIQPAGDWMRIDVDNATRRTKFPLHRMIRLTRLTRQVLETAPPEMINPETRAEALQLLTATETAPLKQWDKQGAPPDAAIGVLCSTLELIGLIENLSESAGTCR
ncbi:hypothetical protein KQI84_18185 [bacterium]|nr:hypothetical protein [bacterium]